MDKKVQYIKMIINKIIKELIKKEYDIDKDNLNKLKDLSNKVQVFFDGDEDIYTFSEDFKKYRYEIPERMPSCVLEFYPQKTNNTFSNIYPIMYLVQFKNKDVFMSTLYHEICHLLSIGEWKKVNDNEITHISGISEKKYTYSDEILEEGTEIDNVNEEINDWVAKILYEKLEERGYSSNKRPQYNKCQNYIKSQVNSKLNGNFPKAIGYYFKNDITKLKEILISDHNRNLEQLDKFFEDDERRFEEECR